MKSKNLLRIIFIVIVILLIPLIAMQFTNDVHWELLDFIIAGVLLFGFGLLFDLIIRKAIQSKYKAVFIGILIVLLLLIWLELAVGIFDSPFSGS